MVIKIEEQKDTLSAGKAYNVNTIQIGDTVFNLLVTKENNDTHIATKKGEESRVEHLMKKATTN